MWSNPLITLISTHLITCCRALTIGWLVSCVLWHIKPCGLSNAKSGLDIYTKYIRYVNKLFVGNIFKQVRVHLLAHS